jgi:uncharacterized protein YpmB
MLNFLIFRKANDDFKNDKKMKFSFFIIMIISIFVCIATPVLLFTFFGQMQPYHTTLEKPTRKITTEESLLLADIGKYVFNTNNKCSVFSVRTAKI